MASLQLFRGTISLVGPTVDILAQDTIIPDTNPFIPTNVPYHITVVSKNELRTLKSDAQTLHQLQEAIGQEPPLLHALGLGGYPLEKPAVFFVVIIWAKGQQLRKRLGLPPKHFHITLSQQDTHDIDKGIDSLLGDPPSTLPLELLDHLAFTLFAVDDYARAKEFAVQLCRRTPESEKGFLRLGDAALKLSEHKLAMLSYAFAYQKSPENDTKAQTYTLRRVLQCAQETEWGTICAERELEQIPDDIALIILRPWSSDLRVRISEANTEVPTLCIMPRDHLFIPAATFRLSGDFYYRLPRFFRWLVPFRIALMSQPREALDIAALGSVHLGIRHVLTLTEETPLPKEWFHGTPVRNTFCPIPNYHPPTVEQVDIIIKLLCNEDHGPVLIHCGGGKGRAGTVAACYIVAFGFSPPPLEPITLTQPTMSAPEAIAALRAIRPGSIETEQQEAFVSKWCSTIWRRQSVVPRLVPEPLPCPLEIDGSLEFSTNLFIFVGLPGSGKSWVSHALLARDPDGWTWISQDEAGNRSACETAIGRSRQKRKVIFDRCNTSRDDRKAWLALAALWAVSPVCVWFDYPIELCVSRAQNRYNHPTLPPGGRVRNAVKQMQEIFIAPSREEGFSAVVIIRSFAAAEEFVRRVSSPINLFKFPRTAHIINLGAATDDDIVVGGLPLDGASSDAHIVITEKVDGANIGFSLSADRTQVIVQNRSHYVNPASHAQFKKLGLWVDTHREDLYKVLDRDPYFAQRYVLFGEWLTTVHSVTYTKLPDWFIAFDLYDRTTRSWADRNALASLLAGTQIRLTPLVYEGPMPSEEELKTMVQRQSQFTEGRLEGVYVKLEREGKVVGRGKVVRGDFIAGNEHWTKGILRSNQLEFDK
ncbi:ATP dependent DNA ligase [Irpex rosettiformis]|uniref:ATP dependent DNA ligase n=1 Tax=Irpex rosettiformis TaxID=378272 RepID=A0ACB8ULI1_9APHY|nr:ATP dependent DNA ligase [Irpex rosettiformis]